jgi:hypothetical protein
VALRLSGVGLGISPAEFALAYRRDATPGTPVADRGFIHRIAELFTDSVDKTSNPTRLGFRWGQQSRPALSRQAPLASDVAGLSLHKDRAVGWGSGPGSRPQRCCGRDPQTSAAQAGDGDSVRGWQGKASP